MSLPKISYPIHSIEVPSMKKSFNFRPFLVKEEKILLMAKETNDVADYLTAMKQVINNCCVDNSFDIDQVTTFDIEYLFLKLRAFSVDNVVKITYIDNEDEKPYEFSIDLHAVKVVMPEKINNIIKLTDTTGIIMKYPSAKLYDDKEFINNTKEYMFELIARCLDKLYSGDEVYDFSQYTPKEISEFLENLDIKTFNQINEFLINTPKLYHCINYKNSLGHDRKIEFRTLDDFFS